MKKKSDKPVDGIYAKELLLKLKNNNDAITRGHLSYLKTQLNLIRGEHYDFDNRGRILYTPSGVTAIINREDGRRKK